MLRVQSKAQKFLLSGVDASATIADGVGGGGERQFGPLKDGGLRRGGRYLSEKSNHGAGIEARNLSIDAERLDVEI